MSKLTDWYVVDMDDGIVRRERTKYACLKWAKGMVEGDYVESGRKRMHDGFYEYLLGFSREDRTCFWIARGDAAQSSSFNLDQEPLYPYPDYPYELGERPQIPFDDGRNDE